MKPHIRKINGLYFCGHRRVGYSLEHIGIGYTKEQAYWDWRGIYGMCAV